MHMSSISKTKPKAIICDIDGVLCEFPNFQSLEHFYQNIDKCIPINTMIDMINSMHDYGYGIIFITARKEACWNETYKFLRESFYFPFDLYMRKNNDLREDWVIKEEYLLKILEEYDVKLCIDDNMDNLTMFYKHGIKSLLAFL